MTITESLVGQLLVAQPKNTDGHFAKSIVLVAQHSLTGAWGVIVNRPAKTLNMTSIMNAAGIEFESNEIAYVGGPVEPARVHVIHTMDWFSSSTLRITEELGITGDRTILAAIAQGQGPKLYRAGVGLAVWSAGQLEGEQSGVDPWGPNHRWLTTPGSVELCLTGSGEEQWQRAINQCVNQRIKELF
jgi:putative transcriptional regulator